MNTQSEALRLADALERMPGYDWNKNYCEAAAELRRLHKENSALRREVAALSANALDDYKMIQSLMAERQPLTDEQLKPLIQKAMRYYGHSPDHWHLTAGAGYCLLARDIEAAHGIKEEA